MRKKMKIKNKRTNPAMIAITVIVFIGVVTSIFTIKYKLDYSQMIATAGLLFAIAAFSLVLLNLNATYIQLQRALAKPKLEISFGENGGKECILGYSKGKLYIALWVVNKGNAITDLFQIDIHIPVVFVGGLRSNTDGLVQYHENQDEKISSLINRHVYICFINRPIQLPYFELKIRPNQEYEPEYEIPYRVYGDWAEPQEGKLKVIIQKEEVPDVPTSS